MICEWKYLQRGGGASANNAYPAPLSLRNTASSYYNAVVLKYGRIYRNQEADQRPSGRWVKKLAFFLKPPSTIRPAEQYPISPGGGEPTGVK